MQSRGPRGYMNACKRPIHSVQDLYSLNHMAACNQISHSLGAAIFGLRVDSIALKLEWFVDNTATEGPLSFQWNVIM